MSRPMLGSALRSALRDPLGHFLVLGVLLFGGYSLLDRGRAHADATSPVVVGTGEVRWLTETWSRQWRREPSPEELRDLVTGLVREELLARGAREMRLDQDDVIVRRRLAQKLEFLLRDTVATAEPGEDELQRLYEEHRERFRAEARRSFTQILFSSALRAAPLQDAMRALHRIKGASPPSASGSGDPQLLPENLRDADEPSVAAQFGPEFARQVFRLEVGAWTGPIGSAYGQHLVRVDAATPAHQRSLAEARDEVVELWRTLQGREQEARYLAELSAKYRVVLDESVQRMIGQSPILSATRAQAP